MEIVIVITEMRKIRIIVERQVEKLVQSYHQIQSFNALGLDNNIVSLLWALGY